MRSPGDGGRSRQAGEWALRAITLGALGVLLWRWTHPLPAAAAAPELVDARDSLTLGRALTRWTAAPAPAGHVALVGAPGARERDWLRALADAGMRVTWSARDARPLAASAEAVTDPAGGVRVEVTDGPGAVVAVGDAFAAADTVRIRGGHGAVVLPTVADSVIARIPGTMARLSPPRAPRLGAVLVLGRAGWEAKFVAAALEERGWPVRLRVSVAPGIDVTQGGDAAIDTATTAAVVVLDSGVVSAADGARLARYVRAGGGLVLAGDAADAATLRPLAAGTSGAAVPGVPGAVDGATPQRGLALRPLDSPRADALVLERRDASAGAPVSVAARRVGAGRVAQTGYAETWRWRMAADDGAPAAHRAWWARVVGAVAYAPTVPDTTPNVILDDPAPLAATIAALGAPRAVPSDARRSAPDERSPGDGALAALAAAALLGEVASRRMRGTR